MYRLGVDMAVNVMLSAVNAQDRRRNVLHGVAIVVGIKGFQLANSTCPSSGLKIDETPF
jgi:hypothetical protein